MEIEVRGWQMTGPGAPLAAARRTIDTSRLRADEVVVKVAGCGVCHTDLGFLYDGVRTKHALPLVLGHEVSGTVVAHGGAGGALEGRAVVVPAVLPCGECALCTSGRSTICDKQVFPGNDDHGGFATHLVVPGRWLCPVDLRRLAHAGLELADLSVVADAVSTPFHALRRAEVRPRDLTIFVGAGGVGAFGVQLAKSMGAFVVAIDVDPERLELVRAHGADEVIDAKTVEAKKLRESVRAFADARGLPRVGWKIFETSGTAAGQLTAYSLLVHGAVLSVVGFTRDAVELRLSNLMAFDAVARGSWACDPALYPEIIEKVLSGEVRLGPFIERRPLDSIQETFEQLRSHALKKRPVLIPAPEVA
jgi:6-hydroxycyclohex-1-ene-1-carbonyl-CoA dehydrogenase